MKIKYLVRRSLIIILSILLVGCGSVSSKSKTEGFDDSIQELALSLISSDDLNLNYMFVDPSKYGISKTDAVLPYFSEEEFKQDIKDTESDIKLLKSFDYKSLSKEQQLTYDVTMDSLEAAVKSQNYYYLSQNYLGSYIGFQAQLPLLLGDWNLNDGQDVRSYLNLLKQMPETFKKYADLEVLRQEKGVGMGQNIIDKVIKQCDSVLEHQENYFLINKFEEKIQKTSFLTDTEKKDYIKQNQELMVSGYFEGYRVLKSELEKIDASQFNDKGLASKPNGKKYYEYLAMQESGSKLNMSDMKKYLNNQFIAAIVGLQTLMNSNPEMIDTINNGDYHYTDLNTGEAVLDYILGQMENDFPKARKIPYEMSKVDDSMKDNFSPAAYLSTRIDANDNNLEKIFINGDYLDESYPTYAHEGYPGHMYQAVYYRDTSHPLIRDLLSYSGYTEGWGTYSENFATKYAQDDQLIYEFLRLNSEAIYAHLCLLDIGIHYDNWTKEEAFAFIRKINPEISDADAQAQYDIQLENPTNYLTYYMGYFQFMDLSEMMQKELGNLYTPKAFHEVILNTGAAPFNILEKQVKLAIKGLKK